MHAWASDELRHARLGDARFRRRLIRVVEDLAAHPTASVPEASGDWAATKGAYRLWDSPRVTASAIRAAHFQRTGERLQGHTRVLVIQDTTDLDYTAHPTTKGLGPLAHSALRGLKAHSALAVSSEGVPLGLVDQAVWARDPETVGKRHQRRQRATKDKESQRWLTAQQASERTIAAEIPIVTIADREAAIDDLVALPRRPNADLLIRACHNRRVEHEASDRWDAIRQSAVVGQSVLEIGRRPNQLPRQVILTVRVATLKIAPPRHHQQRASLRPIPVQVILA